MKVGDKLVYPNLIAEMAKRKIKRSDLADTLGVHRNAIYYKLEKGSFTIEEAELVHTEYFPDYPMKELFKRE